MLNFSPYYTLQPTEEMFFTDINTFLGELDRREKNTLRPLINTKKIKFLNKEDVLKKNGQQMIDNRLFLKVSKDIYPISETAYNSIKTRIDIYGDGLFLLPDNILKNVLNDRIHDINEVRVVVIDDKVRAILSKYYKVMPIQEVVESIFESIRKKFNSFEFLSAYLTYNILYMKILFPEKAEIIRDLYGKDIKYTPGMLLVTSDTGFASNRIYPIWHVKGGSIIFGDVEENIKIAHRGKEAKIDNLKDEIPNIFLKFRNTIELVKEQMKYKVKYPALTIENACKKLGVTRKGTRQMLERLELFCYANPDAEITGYNITEMFINMARDEKDENKKRRLEIIAGKALNLKYEKLDREIDE